MEAKITQFQVLPGADRVSYDEGKILGVAVLSIGPALGHGISIDQTGLQQCLAACQARGSVRLIDKHDGEFEDIVGAITNFRIEGNAVRGDADLLSEHPMRGRILEIATKIPTEFGLSIESAGQHEFAGDGKPRLFRCTDVDAIALVPRPAANRNGLFSAKTVDTPPKANLRTMSKLKSALTQFAKLAKLEEGDVLDNVIDAVVEAVEASNEPEISVEDRLKKLEEKSGDTSIQDRLAKLEEGKTEGKSEEDKKEEMSKFADEVATKAMTKLSKEFGLGKHSTSGEGFQPHNDLKTKFEAAIVTQLHAGAKDRVTAIARVRADNKDLYNEARKNGLY